MIKKYAFTLLEVLISLALSSFIMIGMFRIYMNTVSFVNKSREQLIFNRKTYLLFDQLEKDLSASFIPALHEEEKVEQSARPKEGEKKDTEKKIEIPKQTEEKKGPKKDISFFMGTIYEGETQKIQGSKWELFKSLNFITTNPLQVYGQKRVRLVRVMYELVKDKEKSTKDKTSYTLFRKETEDLENEKFKDSEEISTKEKQYSIRKQIIAENVKGFYLKYMDIKEEKNKESKKTNKELSAAFTWGQKDESKSESKEQKNPCFILLKISLWDDSISFENSFDNVIQIFAYSNLSAKEEDIENKKEEPKMEDKKGKEKDGATRQPSGNNDETSKSTDASTDAVKKPSGGLIQ